MRLRSSLLTMPWSIVISLVALAVSAATFNLRLRSESRDLFLKVHEKLLEPDLMEGREILYALTSPDDVDALPRESRSKLFRLFALYDVLALYVRQGWIPPVLVLDEWSESLKRSREPGAHFIAWRHRVTSKAWPHYQWLAGMAATPNPRVPWRLRLRVWMPRRW